MSPMNEDTLVQETTADYLKNKLGWRSVFAWSSETYGPNGTLGRKDQKEVVLTRELRKKLAELNPGYPDIAYDDAVRQIVEYTPSQTTIATNREKYELLRNGVKVSFKDDKGQQQKRTLRVFDFDDPENNDFLAVRELWVQGSLYRRRVDLAGFVNGIPLLFVECKNVHKNLRAAFNANLSDYKDTIPHLFHHNAFVMLANGIRSKMGSISASYGHFYDWKRLDEEEAGVVDMETMLKGVCSKKNFMDLFENFIVFDESAGKTAKIVARNHQFLGVNRAVESVKEKGTRDGKLGVFWHTQGSGKSYSMAFFTQKVHRKLGGNYTFLICTDRDDLDTQIYKTFAGVGLADNDKDPCRAASGKHLRELLGQHKAFVFTLVQKFYEKIEGDGTYSDRDDIIVITDEAHRTQYGTLALNMRNALPNASYIGFTGTPLFKEDEITRQVFGDYVSTYDFKRAVDDGATVPLFYDARGDKLGIATDDLNEKIAAKLEEVEIEDRDVEQRLETELTREYHILTAGKRLDQVAKDLVKHYANAWETGKAMLVCIDKVTCVRMHGVIQTHWQQHIDELEAGLAGLKSQQEEMEQRRKIEWMKETVAAVIVSEEQGEVAKFKNWGLDIEPHRKIIKEGFDLGDGKRIGVEEAFKKEEHPFRIAIVCAMWLTGFDVPSLSTLYLDKPLKAHTLMQAIARANRVNEGKNNGLIVDYCGVLKNLRKALATFGGATAGGDGGEHDPTRPPEELVAELVEAIGLVREFLDEADAPLDDIITKTGFERNAAIVKVMEAANDTDESRRRFEVMCRAVFRKFRAASALDRSGVNPHRDARDAVNTVYKMLQRGKEAADISHIIRQLHAVVDGAIEVHSDEGEPVEEAAPYDISKIDFDKLRAEFEKGAAKKTIVQDLRSILEKRLQRLLAQNPLRTDFQQRYEKIVDEYNKEKDRATIEATFQQLELFMQALTEEEARAIREGLDEETLAIFDLLRKDELGAEETKAVKAVAKGLLTTLKTEKLRIDHWRDKESTRDAVRQTIYDHLYQDETGLPADLYSEEEVEEKAEVVYEHVHRVYPRLPSPYYEEPAAAV